MNKEQFLKEMSKIENGEYLCVQTGSKLSPALLRWRFEAYIDLSINNKNKDGKYSISVESFFARKFDYVNESAMDCHQFSSTVDLVNQDSGFYRQNIIDGFIDECLMTKEYLKF